MEASVVNMRHRMKEIMKALERNEEVKVLYHGKLKGIIKPIQDNTGESVTKHQFFGMLRGEPESVEETLQGLRGMRYR
jgi:hypothetical protein